MPIDNKNTLRRPGRRFFLGSTLAGTAMLTGCGIFKDDPKPILAGKRYDVLSTGAARDR
nr:hypothetical protein [Asaia astilbis]